MKNLFSAGLLALALTGLSAPSSFAGAFGLIPHHHCCSCGCSVCIRPYNAFSPVCCGTMYCDGCFPFTGGPGGPGGCGPGGCAPGGLNYFGLPCDGGCVGQGDPVSDPSSTPPTATVGGVPPGSVSHMAAYPPQTGLSAVGYYPGYGYGYVPQLPAYGAGMNAPAGGVGR
jgi:hypothetical protein